jgi:hypothetical protein
MTPRTIRPIDASAVDNVDYLAAEETLLKTPDW